MVALEREYSHYTYFIKETLNTTVNILREAFEFI